MLNIYPFPHLVVAIALVRLWEAPPRWRRAAAAAGAATILAGSAYVHGAIWRTLSASGGKGLWSAVRMRHAAELVGEAPPPTVVALDWGFAWGFRYAQPRLDVVDLPVESRRRSIFQGDGRTEYLLFPDRYAVFSYGERFLAAVRRLPPMLVSVRDHYDGQGDLAFQSVRIRQPHRLRLGRDIAIELLPAP
jgi:hypothetical protein